MNPLNPIERAAFNAMNEWRVKHGLAPLREPEDMAESDKYRFADEDEPDRYPNDKYLDDPRHAQCEGGKFKE